LLNLNGNFIEFIKLNILFFILAQDLLQLIHMKSEMPQIYEIEEILDLKFADYQQNSNEIDLTNILDQLQSTDKILSIKLQIDEHFDEICSDELKILSEKCTNKSIVILLISKHSEKVLIYWKSKEIDNFLALKHYGENYSKDDKKVYEFIAEFLTRSLSRGQLGEFDFMII